jgi:hypothetical protein
MFNRNRIIGAAIGLIAIGLSGLFAQEIIPHAGDAAKEGQRPVVIDNPKSQTETGDSTKEGSTKTGNFCGASFALHCQPNAIPTDKHEDARNGREERDIIAQESVADSTASILWWTRVQLLLSGLGIAGLGWTLYESRRAANAAVDSATAAHATVEQARETNRIAGEASAVEQRAWLLVDVTTPLNWSYQDTALYGGIAVSITNVGKTPAVRCRVMVDAKCADGYGGDPEDEQRLRQKIECSKEYWAHFSAVLPSEKLYDYFPFVALQPSRSNMMPRLSLLIAYDLHGGKTAYVHKLFDTSLTHSPKDQSHKIEWLMDNSSGAVQIRSAGGGFVY